MEWLCHWRGDKVMSGSHGFKGLTPWVCAAGPLIAASFICALSGNSSTAVLFQATGLSVDKSKLGDVSQSAWEEVFEEWSDRTFKKQCITFLNEVGGCIITIIHFWLIGATDMYSIAMICYPYAYICIFFRNYINCVFQLWQPHLEITLNSTVIPSHNMYTWKQVSGVLDRDLRRIMPGWKRFACLHEPLITWFSRQISPRGWLNTIAFPSSRSQVCVAKHTARQWNLAVWMMVITLPTEAASVPHSRKEPYGEHP